MKPSSFLPAVATSIITLSLAPAAQLYWDGNGSATGAGDSPTGIWGVSNYWNDNSTGGSPTISFTATTSGNDDLHIVAAPSATSGNNGTIITVYGTHAANSLHFQHSGAFSLFSGALALGNGTPGSGGISVAQYAYGTTAQGAVTISGTIALNNSQNWTNQAGNTLLLNNSTTSVLSGSANLTINGTGRISIVGSASGTPGYSGNMIITNGGELESRSDITATTGPLGTGNVEINGGVVGLYLSNTLTRSIGSGPGQLRITGGISGFTGNGNSNSTFTISGMTWGTANFNPSELLLQNATAGANGKGTLTSPINLNGTNRIIRSNQSSTDIVNGYGLFSGDITNSSGSPAGLIKNGIGQHILSGTNTYNGGTVINQGTLRFDKLTAMPSGGNIQVNNGSTLGIKLGGAGNWSGGSSGAGTLGGLLAGLGGAGSSTINYSGNVGLLLDVAATTSFSGNITNLGTGMSLTKIGNDALTLSGTNNYTGPTSIRSGRLQFAKAASLYNGSTVSWTSSNIKVASGGTLALNVGGSGEFTSGNLTTLLTNLGGANGGTGGGLASGASIGLDTTNAGTFTVSNNIINSSASGGGAIGVMKLGTGTLVLTGSNTYTGGTAINGGTLALGANHVLSDSSAVSISSATLNAATFTDTAGTLDISGTATINLGNSAALAFVDSSSIDWTGGTLNITGTLGATSLRFGTTSSGLTAAQLVKISLNGSGLGTYTLNSSGYLVASPYLTWSGGAAFGADANGDGVENGLAFLLGATNLNSVITLPPVTHSGGGLTLTFSMRNAASRGSAKLTVEHSHDVGLSDPWTAVLVTDGNSGPTNGVTFVVTPGSPSNNVQATISSSQASSGKLFARLKAEP